MLTREQITWAKQHDWYVRDYGNGVIVVRDRWLDTKTGKVHDDELVWNENFALLRLWAGY